MTEPTKDSSRIARAVVAMSGFVAMLAGIAAFDWRMSFIVGGALALIAGVAGTIVAGMSAKRKR